MSQRAEYLDYATLDSGMMHRVRVRAETVDIGPAKDVPCGPVAVALSHLNYGWYSWRQKAEFGFMRLVRRKPVAAQAAALISHDRILNGQIASRGLVSFYIT
jgi:hypothetical protein